MACGVSQGRAPDVHHEQDLRAPAGPYRDVAQGPGQDRAR